MQTENLESNIADLQIGTGIWRWRSKAKRGDTIIVYGCDSRNSAYAPKLYDYTAYKVKKVL
jgi:hypothetical protein